MEEGEHSVYLFYRLEKSQGVDFFFLISTLNFFWFYKLTSLLAAHYFPWWLIKNHLLLIISMAVYRSYRKHTFFYKAKASGLSSKKAEMTAFRKGHSYSPRRPKYTLIHLSLSQVSGSHLFLVRVLTIELQPAGGWEFSFHWNSAIFIMKLWPWSSAFWFSRCRRENILKCS